MDNRRGIRNYGSTTLTAVTVPTVSSTGQEEETQEPAVPGDFPNTTLEFDNNPLYHCLCAQMNNRNPQCCGTLNIVLGIAAFPILRHGWIQDFCIVWCTDYLSQLEEVRRNPQTPQDTRDTIQELLRWFDYQSLIEESRRLTETRMWGNLLYTIQRPFILFMCIPYMGCMIILVFGVLFMHVPSFSSPVPYWYYSDIQWTVSLDSSQLDCYVHICLLFYITFAQTIPQYRLSRNKHMYIFHPSV